MVIIALKSGEVQESPYNLPPQEKKFNESFVLEILYIVFFYTACGKVLSANR